MRPKISHPMLDVRQAAVTQPHSRSHEAKGTPSGATAAALLSWLDTPREGRDAATRSLKSPFGRGPTEGV